MSSMPLGAMTETSLGVFGVGSTLLKCVAAGFAFAEAALFGVEPTLTEDGTLRNAAMLAAGRTNPTGVGVVVAFLVFTSVLISLGIGFILAATVLRLSTKVGAGPPWLAEVATGASFVAGAVTTGVLVGILPLWIYVTVQVILLLTIYSYSNINDVTTALVIIFITLYIGVIYGKMGFITGLFIVGLTISFLCGLRKALTNMVTRTSNTGCKLFERMFFYTVFVGILGFTIGLVAGETRVELEAEVVLMLQSVLWVAYLSAGLLGAGLGTVAMVGLGPETAGKAAVGAAIISSVSLRAILYSSSSLGPRSILGGTLGATTAAGVSLGAASVAAEQVFESRKSTLTVLGSVSVGAILAIRGVALTATLLSTSELITITLVAAGAFVLGAPKSPFNTQVNLRTGHLTGPELIKGIGMETVTAAAAPIGAGALGAATLATAALGRMGTAGVVVAILLALGSTLSGMIGKSPPTTSSHRD